MRPVSLSRRVVLRFECMFFGYSSLTGAHALILDACVLSFWRAALRKRDCADWKRSPTTALHQKESRCIEGTALHQENATASGELLKRGTTPKGAALHRCAPPTMKRAAHSSQPFLLEKPCPGTLTKLPAGHNPIAHGVRHYETLESSLSWPNSVKRVVRAHLRAARRQVVPGAFC